MKFAPEIVLIIILHLKLRITVWDTEGVGGGCSAAICFFISEKRVYRLNSIQKFEFTMKIVTSHSGFKI